MDAKGHEPKRRSKAFRSLLPTLLFLPALLGAAPTLEQLIADPGLWPKEVTVTASARGTVLKDGRPAGMMLIGAGKKIVLMGIAADGVTGKLGGATVRVPVARTNLLEGGGEEAPAPAEDTVTEAAAERAPTAMQRQLSGKLVRMDQGSLRGVEADATLAGVKYYALYYSASWCGPCRRFTPGFVRFYRQMKAKHPEFEVVFVSADHSAKDMAGYMKEDQMPWPAVKYELIASSGLQRHAGPGIPCVVLMDANGKVLSHSYDGGNYRGPGQVLQDTQRILAKGS